MGSCGELVHLARVGPATSSGVPYLAMAEGIEFAAQSFTRTWSSSRAGPWGPKTRPTVEADHAAMYSLISPPKIPCRQIFAIVAGDGFPVGGCGEPCATERCGQCS